MSASAPPEFATKDAALESLEAYESDVAKDSEWVARLERELAELEGRRAELEGRLAEFEETVNALISPDDAPLVIAEAVADEAFAYGKPLHGATKEALIYHEEQFHGRNATVDDAMTPSEYFALYNFKGYARKTLLKAIRSLPPAEFNRKLVEVLVSIRPPGHWIDTLPEEARRLLAEGLAAHALLPPDHALMVEALGLTDPYGKVVQEGARQRHWDPAHPVRKIYFSQFA